MNFYEKLPKWVWTNRLYHAKLKPGTESFDSSYDDERKIAGWENANLISSYAYTRADGVEMHTPIIDLDIEHMIVPSTTPGHGHLYINKEITYNQYLSLLEKMAECGIVQRGIVGQCQKYKGTTVRLPHIKKEN